MNEERSAVQDLDRSVVKDLPMMVHAQQITFLDEVEIHAKWIHPECVRLDWVTHSDVACNAFVQAVVPKNAVGACQTSFDVFALFELIGELELRRRKEANLLVGSLGEVHGFGGAAAV